MNDYYQILGVPRDAPLEDLKRRYRFLSQAYHPDKFRSTDHKAEAEAEFKLINEAFQTLSNPEKRHMFDLDKAVDEKKADAREHTKSNSAPSQAHQQDPSNTEPRSKKKSAGFPPRHEAPDSNASTRQNRVALMITLLFFFAGVVAMVLSSPSLSSPRDGVRKGEKESESDERPALGKDHTADSSQMLSFPVSSGQQITFNDTITSATLVERHEDKTPPETNINTNRIGTGAWIIKNW